MNPISSDLIPLFIGIVGHRDIADEDKPRLKILIKQVIEDQKALCPHTQIVLLSPLAEGADRLGAFAAIECEIPYIAVLPMPLHQYRKDFKTEESLHEFNDLYNKARFHFELPSREKSGINTSRDNKQREELFHDLGYFMARISHMLIALWDGEVNNKTGGTANVVNMKIEGIPVSHPYYTPRLRHMRTGPVCHIITPRKGQTDKTDAFRTKILSGQKQGKIIEDKRHHTLLKNIDVFNSDFIKYQKKSDKEKEFGFNSLGISNFQDCHKIFDALAKQYQKRRFRALKLLLILAVVAFIFFQLYVEFWDRALILLMYPVTIGIGALWFLRANRLRYEQKHEDYRALSEAFRVQHYLFLIDRNINVSDYYLQKHEGELEWITYILRTTHFLCNLSESENVNAKSKSTYEHINQNWVKEQAGYHRRKSKEYEQLLRKIKLIGNSLFIGAILSSMILFILNVFQENHSDTHSGILHPLLILFTHTFLVISATLFGYNEKMIFEEQSKTYHYMYRLFSTAEKELSRAIQEDDHEEAAEIIRELGFESLMENADWLLLHRSRPMEIPKG